MTHGASCLRAGRFLLFVVFFQPASVFAMPVFSSSILQPEFRCEAEREWEADRHGMDSAPSEDCEPERIVLRESDGLRGGERQLDDVPPVDLEIDEADAGSPFLLADPAARNTPGPRRSMSTWSPSGTGAFSPSERWGSQTPAMQGPWFVGSNFAGIDVLGAMGRVLLRSGLRHPGGPRRRKPPRLRRLRQGTRGSSPAQGQRGAPR
jgi:hypothetical protein